MKCDNCGDEDAIVHLAEIHDGKKTQRSLCLNCASTEIGTPGNLTEMLETWVEKQEGSASAAGVNPSPIPVSLLGTLMQSSPLPNRCFEKFLNCWMSF